MNRALFFDNFIKNNLLIMETSNQPEKRRKLNLYRLPPKNFEGKEDVITFNNLSKRYTLQGREEEIVALRNVSLNNNSEFYSVKK